MLNGVISPNHSTTSLYSSYQAIALLSASRHTVTSCPDKLNLLAHTQTVILTTIYIMSSTRVQICCRVRRQTLKFNDAQQQDGERMSGVTALMSAHIAKGSDTSTQRTSQKAHFCPPISSKKPIHNCFCCCQFSKCL